jgi:hypothetical protein
LHAVDQLWNSFEFTGAGSSNGIYSEHVGWRAEIT